MNSLSIIRTDEIEKDIEESQKTADKQRENEVKQIEKENMRLDLPLFDAGDTVKVYVKISEGDKERTQAFQGVVIKKRKGTTNATFTVRRISYGEGVERVFPVHSPRIDRVDVERRGAVRRAKLTYLRKRIGKSAVAVKEKPRVRTKKK